MELNSNRLMAGVQGNDGIARYGRNGTLTGGGWVQYSQPGAWNAGGGKRGGRQDG